MEQTESAGFSDLMAALRRRRRLMVSIAAPVAAAAILLAAFAPTRYQSTAVFTIEEARLSELGNTVAGQRDSYVDQYIKDLEGVVLSSPKIRSMLEEQKRMPEKEAAQSSLVDSIQKQTRLRVISEKVLDPQTGRERTIISSFELHNQDGDAQLAQQTTAWLANQFIEADRNSRLTRSENYVRFLGSEEQKRKQQVDALDQQLAEFKQRNIGQLPELNQMNLEFKDRAERGLQDSDAQLRTLVRERAFVQQQMQQAGAQTSGAQRLQELQDTYRERLQSYDANHPDMLALQREIDQLRTGGGRRSGSLRDQLASQEQILAQARQRYSDDHPDIIRLQRSIASLQARIAAGETADTSATPLSANELQLRTQLNSLDMQISLLQSQSAEFRSRIAAVRSQIQSTPQVEREYQALNQDLTVARTAYQDSMQRKINAEAAASAIASGSADVFRLTQRASLPGGSVKTHSAAILAIGLFAAVTLAFGSVLLAEMIDPAVRGSRDVRQILGVTPLAIIPEIHNSTSHAQRRAGLLRLAASLLAVTVVLFLLGYKISA